MKSIVLSAPTAHLVHLFFEWAAIASGVQMYRWQRARHGQSGILESDQYVVIIGCILGAALGNKLAFWFEFPQLWRPLSLNIATWMSGQSIVGGLLGGLLGVELAKKLSAQTQSTGDNFVLSLMVGTVIGRIGCFLAGLNDGTFGNATQLPWGIDFGDGILRHPTQLYDMAFVLIWGGTLLALRRCWEGAPGLLFKLYLAGYLGWRLLIDGIKPVPYDVGFGLSGIQALCLFALLLYLPLVVRQLFEKKNNASV